MRSRTRLTLGLIVGGAILFALLLHLALKSDQVTRQAPTLDRAPTAPPLRELPAALETVATGQRVYVPVYSHVYGGRGKQIPLAVTLSVRNVDTERQIVIESLRYFDNDGNLLRDYLKRPFVLDPLASTDFLVEQRDMAGGVGANFLLDWVAQDLVTPPLIEAVMVSSESNRAFSFVRYGTPLQARPDGD